MAGRRLEIIDGDGIRHRASCDSLADAVEYALRMTAGTASDEVCVRFLPA